MSTQRRSKRANIKRPDLRQDNARLRTQLAKLAALMDHFYCGYRETQALLDRREHELADLRRRLDLKPVALNR